MDAIRRRVAVRALIALTIMALVAACQATRSTDKAGGDTAVLTLATIDEVNNNGQSYGPQAFVDSLAKVSGGRFKVQLKTQYGNGAAEAESNIVKAIASGDLDGGWPSTRAFASGGIKGLEVVEAPMTITSYAAQKALVSGPVADKLITRLDDSGVVGLGLAVGPLRRPFAAKAPLLGPEDWEGARFRVYNSPVQADAVRALGATPANLGFGWIDEVRAGSLRGAEFDIAQYAKNDYSTEAGHVTANVVLWPKMFVLSFSKKRLNALTAQQQTWVREAAKQAVKASVDAPYDETTPAQQMCTKGARFSQASPDQVRDLRSAFRPVLDRLAADPSNGQLLRQVQAVAAKHPQPEVPTVPAGCRPGTADQPTLGEIPTQVSPLPEGVYRVEITTEDVAAAGLDEQGWAGTWTLTVRNGTYQLGCRPLAAPGSDCATEVSGGPFEAGDLRGTGNTVYFVYNPELLSRLTGCKLPASNTAAGHCWDGFSYRMTWTWDGKTLRFSDYRSTQEDQQYLIEPWRKIA
jgi:TRAP-type C4-dicarboxylate transport system substrate-binding protein